MFHYTKHTLSIDTHQFFLLLSISLSQPIFTIFLVFLLCQTLLSKYSFILLFFIGNSFIPYPHFIIFQRTNSSSLYTLFLSKTLSLSLSLSLFLPLITQYNYFINPYSFISCLLTLLNVSPKPAIVHDISTQHLQISFSSFYLLFPLHNPSSHSSLSFFSVKLSYQYALMILIFIRSSLFSYQTVIIFHRMASSSLSNLLSSQTLSFFLPLISHWLHSLRTGLVRQV